MSAEFTTITIDGDEFITTKGFAKALRTMVVEAELVTLEAHPHAAECIPLYLTTVGAKVIQAIKEWRYISGKNLKDAKHDIDKVRFNGDRLLIGKVSIREAREITDRFEEIGCKTSLPGPLFMLAKAGVDPEFWENPDV